MERIRNIAPYTKTVPGHGKAEPGQELPRQVPEQVARHLLKSGGWELVSPVLPEPPAQPVENKED